MKKNSLILMLLLGAACATRPLDAVEDRERLASQLAQQLLIEGPPASAPFESNDFLSYDATVENILRRRDVAVVPQLLELVNDMRVVQTTGQVERCWYDAPLYLRDKVRFVLRRLLGHADYARMIGESEKPVDIDSAQRYFERNRSEIAARLSRDPIVQQ